MVLISYSKISGQMVITDFWKVTRELNPANSYSAIFAIEWNNGEGHRNVVR